VARVFERTVRQVGLPVAYSQGFSPRARLSFGLALSTGHESNAEYLDIDLDPSRVVGVDCATVAATMNAVLPEGMTVTAVAAIEPGADSLQQIVTSCSYRVDFLADPFGDDTDPASRAAVGLSEALAGAAAKVRDATSLIVRRERKGKLSDDDIRPGLLSVEVASPSTLEVELATVTRGVRPAELLQALHSDWAGPPVVHRVCRTHQWTTIDGRRAEPLPASIAHGGAVPPELAAGVRTPADAKERNDVRPLEPRTPEPLGVGSSRD